jgi:non-heme chloroperoxidase
MQSVNIGSLSLAYDEQGSGHPTLFTHGIPTDYRVWRSPLEAVSKAGFRAIAYSRRCAYPNKNEVDATKSTVEENSKDQIALIDELKLQEPVHLVGHSYGGFVSLYTAWKRPELIRSLTLIEPAVPSVLVRNEKNPLRVLIFLLLQPSAAMSARRFQTGLLKKALHAYEARDLRGAVRFFYDGIKEKEGSFEKQPAEIQNLMLDNGKTIGELETVFPIFTANEARTLKMPTLLVKGQSSPKWLRAIVERLSRSIPNSTVVEISRSGHLPHLDNPDELSRSLLGHLKKNE